MKIKTFTIKNYRSIIKECRIPLNEQLTVLVGKNNEGKSNILRALSGAFSIIELLNYLPAPAVSRRILTRYRNNDDLFSWRYNWERDFPISRQSRRGKPETVFELHFSLSIKEQREFYKEIGYKFNEDLPFRILLHRDEINFKIPKKSRGGKSFDARLDKIAKFISSRLDAIYVPAVRPASLTLSVINSLLNRQLHYLSNFNPKYREAIDLIEKMQNKQIQSLQKNLQEMLGTYIPDIKHVELDASSIVLRSRSSVESIKVDDGVSTAIFEKGEGLQSLISLAIMQRTKRLKEGLTVAIDEPESHLHPEAIRKIRENLANISQKGQVIIATHSPILINRETLQANIIVSNNDARPVHKISEIREVLGVSISDNLVNAEYVLLVEGSTDAQILRTILSKMSDNIKQNLASGRLIIKPLHGVTHLSTEKAWLNSFLCRGILCYLDNDVSARNEVKLCKEKKILTSNEVIFASFPGKNNTEIEDLIKEERYLEFLPIENISWQQFLKNKNKKWTDNIHDLFSAAGRECKIEEIKHKIANNVKSIEDLEKEKCGSIRELCGSLEKILNK